MAVFLGYLSCVDIKKREVPDLAVLALFLYSFFAVDDLYEGLKTAAYVFFVLLCVSLITKGGVGGGDIKLLTVLAFLMGVRFYEVMFFAVPVFIAGFTAVFLKERRLNVEVPMVPFIFLFYILWLGGATWLRGSLF